MRALGLERGTREKYGMVVESQEERVKIIATRLGPTVKNVGLLKVDRGRRTAEESRIRRQIIVRTIVVRISELPNAVCSLLVAVVIGVKSEENDTGTDDRR